MDCHDKTTVDFCSEPECLNSVVTSKTRPGLKTPHTPNHDMLKVHRILFDRDTAKAEKNAKSALEAARKTILDLQEKKKPMPPCSHCQNAVSLPCWYCVDCTSQFLQNAYAFPAHEFFCVEKFICADCEHKCLAFNDTHTKKHTLVRVIQKVEESKVSTEERLKALEGQLGSVQEELSKMRQLFSKLFEKGTEGSPSDPLTKGDVLDAAAAGPSLGGPPLTKGEDGGGGEDQEDSDDEDEEGEDQSGSGDGGEDGDEDSDEEGD